MTEATRIFQKGNTSTFLACHTGIDHAEDELSLFRSKVTSWDTGENVLRTVFVSVRFFPVADSFGLHPASPFTDCLLFHILCGLVNCRAPNHPLQKRPRCFRIRVSYILFTVTPLGIVVVLACFYESSAICQRR